MGDVSRVCVRCGGALDGRGVCSNCGASAPETPAYLLGGLAADRAAVTWFGLIPMGLMAAGGPLWSPERPWAAVLVYSGMCLLALEVLAFFTVLRPFQTIRRTFAGILFAYTVPTALATGCVTLIGEPIGGGWQTMLVCFLALALQGIVSWTAFRRR